MLVRCRILAGSSGWECGSVDVSGVPVVPDLCEASSVTRGGVPSDSEWDFVEPQSFSFSKKRNFACVEEQEDMTYERTIVMAPPCRQIRMRTPLPQQGSWSSVEQTRGEQHGDRCSTG